MSQNSSTATRFNAFGISGEGQLADQREPQLTFSERSAGKRRFAVTRKGANDLDGQTWTRYSISIWSDINKTPEDAGLGHPALFPVELPRRLLRCFTTQEDKVALDAFVGLGSAALAAEELDGGTFSVLRRCING